MLDEVISGLAIKPRGVYFDGTVGGGGHSFAILESDPTVRLIGTDRDEEAIGAASERLKPFEGRFQLYKSDYRKYSEVLKRAGAETVCYWTSEFPLIRSTTKREGFRTGRHPHRSI